MPEYLSPGVYVEEVQTGARPIEGVSTSTAGFVGRTERGPTAPRLVTSWSDYVRWFGGYLAENISYLPFSIKGFFDNGGQRAYVARVVGTGSATASITLPAGADSVTLDAIGHGEWGNNLVVRVTAPVSKAAKDAGFFRLTILYYSGGIPSPFLDPTDIGNSSNPLLVLPDATEDYETLSPHPEDSNYFLNAINTRSNLVHLSPETKITVALDNFPFPTTASVDFPTANADTVLQVIARQTGVRPTITVNIEKGGAADSVKITVSKKEEFKDLSPAAINDGKINDSTLVNGSFKNPGTVTPSRPKDTAAPQPIPIDLPTDDAGGTVLHVEAKPQVPSVGLTIAIAGATGDHVNVTITQTLEVYDDLPLSAIINTVNSASKLVRLQWAAANPPKPFAPALPNVPATKNMVNGAGTLPTGGKDEPVEDKDYRGVDPGSPDKRTGLLALRSVDGISMLCVPDEVRSKTGQITDDVVNQCEQLKDRFAVLSIADDSGLVNLVRPPRDSSYGAVYYPFIRIMDPQTQKDILIPPAGHMAGIYARTDVDRGVHKAPANEVVRGILTRDLSADRKPLQFTLSKGEHDILNPRGVDVIRDFRPQRRDIRVWGARTMSSDSQWKYVNVRRLFIFVEQSIDRGTQWVVFEPNDETTWSAVRRSITGFLTTVWRNGALFGATTDEAFFVKCDRNTMTQDDIDNGRLICLIGIAPVKPAEFVIFRISQKTAEAKA